MPSRRRLLATGAALAVAGAARAQDALFLDAGNPLDEGHLDPPKPGYEPAYVELSAALPAGEIHVDPGAFALYFTLGDGSAIRYRVGIAKAGLYESGVYQVGAKKEWPSWTPTAEMVERDPDHYAQYAEAGMPGGPENPLGARALYLFTPEKGDTFMRIHGTTAPETIGSAVSNGCVRMVNSDIVDLYARTVIGAPIFLYPKADAGA